MLKLSLATYRASGGGNLEAILSNQFDEWEKRYNVDASKKDISSRFGNIIKAAYDATGKTVVILVDE